MQRAHHVGPYSSSRMTPKTPGSGSDFLVARLGRKFVQSPKEGTLGTAPGIEPQFRAPGRQIDRIIEHMIGRAEQHAVPFLCQGLPMEIIGRCCPGLGRRNARTMLMHNHGPHGPDAVGDPKRVGNADLQFPRLAGRRINKLQILARVAGWRERPPRAVGRIAAGGRRRTRLSLSGGRG